jgi:hypothetical protein
VLKTFARFYANALLEQLLISIQIATVLKLEEKQKTQL